MAKMMKPIPIILLTFGFSLFKSVTSRPMFSEGEQKPATRRAVSPLLEGEHYVLLSDDEILQNEGLLKHLAAASKEEVEDLVDGNSNLQEALLTKVKAVVDAKQGANIIMEPGVGFHDTADCHQASSGSNCDDEDELVVPDKTALNEIKSKLKSNAVKLFRIGSGLRGKIHALTGKRKRKNKTGSSLPKLRLHVSTS